MILTYKLAQLIDASAAGLDHHEILIILVYLVLPHVDRLDLWHYIHTCSQLAFNNAVSQFLCRLLVWRGDKCYRTGAGNVSCIASCLVAHLPVLLDYGRRRRSWFLG